jgi:hypothetical protein
MQPTHVKQPFYDLIRLRQQRWRNCDAEGLGGLEVDHQLELGRLFDGEVGRLGALEDLVYKSRGRPDAGTRVRPVRHEAPGLHILPGPIHRR